MPKTKGIQTLYNSCIHNIANNINYWTEHYEKHVLKRSPQERRKILFFLGPFDELNSLIVNELIESLVFKKRLTFPALQLLINSGSITKLNLEGASKLVNDAIVTSVAKQCSNLKFLNLSRCKRISAAALTNLSSKLPLALSLNFSWTAINTSALCNIIRTCKKLLELVLKDCKISDETLHEINTKAINGDFLKMKVIDLSDNEGITKIGLRHLLSCMPHLEDVRHHLLLEAISKQEWILPSSNNNYFLLRTLSCLDADMLGDGDMETITDRCPNLYRLEVRLTVHLSSVGLHRLSSLETLGELVLDGNDHAGDFASYRSKVRTPLEACGQGLVTLIVENMKELDLLEVLSFCPKLKNLTVLQHGQPGNFCNGATTPKCVNLSRLCIWSRLRDNSLTAKALESILSSAVGLENLELFQVDNLTDSVLEKVLAVHSMEKLSWLHLQECNHIKGEALSSLVLDDNNLLQKVTLMNNWLVNRADYEVWKRTAADSNLDVQIEWQ